MGCLENMNYEILGRNCSFKEAREIIRANSTERYEVPPGFKLLDKALIGVPPLIIGIANEKLVYAYTKPCHGTFVVVVEDPTGVEVVRRSGKPVK
ncbi:MAG TPA: DUF1894 domain-containing protein [Methanocorpusculum sp.]|nr:DUF1894 domain-containing protein [Methanocorpusculum sp.]HJJ50603.1 DUF1894 domain-containing protein [Methanocorpusculum sp.]